RSLRPLPLLLRRPPPQSNCPPGNVRLPDHGQPLEPKSRKGGISLLTPPTLARRLQSLPPMLHMRDPSPMPRCSKAPRGLFVQVCVTRVFTGISVSPGPSWRQQLSLYACGGCRTLPDKEFRYLRTVIVTAAVHRGFSSSLAALPLTFRHWAGVSPYTSAYAFRETCGFDNQSPGPAHCAPRQLRRRAPSPTGVILLPKL